MRLIEKMNEIVTLLDKVTINRTCRTRLQLGGVPASKTQYCVMAVRQAKKKHSTTQTLCPMNNQIVNVGGLNMLRLF